MIGLDGLKEFDVAELRRNARGSTGQPCELPIGKIYPDPKNIRTQYSEAAIAELAQTIRVDGLLQAITVRRHPDMAGCYMISFGERRWRAVRLLGRSSIAAVIDNAFDPYRQAIENLQREDLTPLQIAEFVAGREAAGDSRTVIAKRLGKSKSFISELAQLSSAPELIREALQCSRIDTRSAYLLARHFQERPEKVTALLSGTALLSRLEVAREFNDSIDVDACEPAAGPQRLRRPHRRDYNALAVQVGGRTGIMSFEPGQPCNEATVRFADGSKETAALSKISLKHWVRQ
ncbi:MAG TPA: ParB/RepB/Spo0J family partition protein [Steroidobacteraceae bacterium]